MRDYFSALLLRHFGERSDIGMEFDLGIATDPAMAGDTPSPALTVMTAPMARVTAAWVRQEYGPSVRRAPSAVSAPVASPPRTATRFDTPEAKQQRARPVWPSSIDRRMATPVATDSLRSDGRSQERTDNTGLDRAGAHDDRPHPQAVRRDAPVAGASDGAPQPAVGSIGARRSTVPTRDPEPAQEEPEQHEELDSSAHLQPAQAAAPAPVAIEGAAHIVEDRVADASLHDAISPITLLRHSSPTTPIREPELDHARADNRTEAMDRRPAPRVAIVRSPVAPPVPSVERDGTDRPSVTVTIERLELRPATVARPAVAARPVTLDAIAARRHRDGMS